MPARPIRRSSVLAGKWLGLVAFGATWIAGVVGEALGYDSVARVGTVSRMLLPTDGRWRGAMNAFPHPSLFASFGDGLDESPFLSQASLAAARSGRPASRPGVVTSAGTTP